MAETQLKRHRDKEDDETQAFSEFHEDTKRHKSYDHILSLLEEEEADPNQDLSDIFSTLQQELSGESNPTLEATDSVVDDLRDVEPTLSASSESSPCFKEGEDDDRSVSVMIRHLLEASDDELGIPNGSPSVVLVAEAAEDNVISGGDGSFPLCDELWEFEDETANYYSLLQSELFI